MGINQLWEVVDDAAETRSLLNLATIEGFEINNRKLRGLVIGVDISIRIKAITAALRTAGILNPPPKLILKRVFYQLCNFLLAPIILVFVFDGPGRPSVKRHTHVVFRASDAELIRSLKTMISDFGFYYYEAPGEAEAELAQLNAHNKLDAIITEDSDSLVFGARCVIRTQGHSVQHTCLVYSQDAIQNTDGVSLDQDGLLLCALLLGGDYDDGVAGFGPKIARTLAACGFGMKLVKILQSFVGASLAHHLGDWRQELRNELAFNLSGLLDSQHPKLVECIPAGFPNVLIAELYLYPLTSKSSIFLGPAPNAISWKHRQPNISSLSSFCSTTFGWHGSQLLKKLNARLWPGAAFKLISSPLAVYYPSQLAFAAPYDWLNATATKVVVQKKSKVKKYHPAFAESRPLNIYRIRVSTLNFVLLAGLASLPNTTAELVSIPEAILAVGMQDMGLDTTDLTLPESSRDSSQDSNSEEEEQYVEAEDCGDNIIEIYDTEEEDLHKAHLVAEAEGIIDLTWDSD